MTQNTIFRGRRLDNCERVTGHGVFFDPPQGKTERRAWIIGDEFPLRVKNWHAVDINTLEMDEENEQ